MILLTGSKGLLATELVKYLPDCVIKTDRHNYDILNIDSKYEGLEYIIHCAAYTDVIGAEKERSQCYKANVLGTFNLVDMYRDVPFVYISSEYALNPVNFYSWTKYYGETVVRKHCSESLILNTLFKPRPFPHSMAFEDQYTTGDYVDVIAPMIVTSILTWLSNFKSKTIHLGTGRKTMYELAKRTNPDVQPGSVDHIKGVVLPRDYAEPSYI